MTADARHLERVRAMIARCWAGQAPVGRAAESARCARVGRVTLRPHQCDAVRQLQRLLDEHRGAVLADAVGLGKTYVALTVAKDAGDPLVVCPAGLRDMWIRAAAEIGVKVTTLTMEGLSRMVPGARRPPAHRPVEQPAPHHAGVPESWTRVGGTGRGLVIVDEAHHVRNPHTQRFRALSRLTARARLLLLTATPIHNHAGDLAALLSLFLGARAWTMSADQRARHIVRRSRDLIADEPSASEVTAMPEIIGPEVVPIGDDAETLRALVALPPPVPPRDGDTCGALTTIGLVRQWSSSAGAFRGALARRLERAVALESALEHGAHPTYRDLRDWCLGDGAVQLAFHELLLPDALAGGRPAGRPLRSPPTTAELLAAVRSHAHAVRALLDQVSGRPDLDITRAERLRAIIRAHAGAKVVAFSAYEDTVRALFRLLSADGGVCALSARGGRIASGQLARAAVIDQFAPHPARPIRAAQRITLLLATDLASEGLNLQGAGAVVHLDLPWTAARIEQRVGRVARLGSPHRHVHVYTVLPPATAEMMLGMERRLHAKLDTARRAIGVAGSVLPLLPTAPGATERTPALGPPESLAILRRLVAGWQRPTAEPPARAGAAPWTACVGGPRGGFLAACVAAGRPVLLARLGGAVSDAADILATAAHLAGGAARPVDAVAGAEADRAIRQWWADLCATEDAGLSSIAGAAPRLRVLGRIAAITRRAPLHARPTLLALGDQARRAVVAPFGSGAESVLDQLAVAPLPDAEWLRAVVAFGEAHAARGARAADGDDHLEIVALILFRPEHDPAG